MGNLHGSQEISLEEQELFEMQVDEDYNPRGLIDQPQARIEYIQRQRQHEAEQLKLKYLDPKVRANLKEPANHNLSRPTVVVKKKAKKSGINTYVFAERDDSIPDKDGMGQDKERARKALVDEEDGDSLSAILQQKERIRSIITPDVDSRSEQLLGGKPSVVGNSDGRSPYNGAALRVVSLNHKKNKKEAIFDSQVADGSNAANSSGAQAEDKSNEPVEVESPGEVQENEQSSKDDASNAAADQDQIVASGEQTPGDWEKYNPSVKPVSFEKQLQQAKLEREQKKEQEKAEKDESEHNADAKQEVKDDNEGSEEDPAGDKEDPGDKEVKIATEKEVGRRDSWSFEPIPNQGQGIDKPEIISPMLKQKATPVGQTPSTLIKTQGKEPVVQVGIITKVVDGKAVQLTSEELVDAERQRQTIEKMQGCPFFAGIKNNDAAEALKQHEQKIVERKASSGNLPALADINNNGRNSSNQGGGEDAVFAAINAFNAAPEQEGEDQGMAHVAAAANSFAKCPFQGNAQAKVDVTKVGGCPMGAKPPQQASAIQDASMFEQFGGDQKMSLFVEEFMENIMGDTELACYHEKFQNPEEMELLKEKLCSYFKYKLDGSKFYIGKPMAEVHKNLGISDEVFDKACIVFGDSLKKMRPKLKVMREFVSRIGSIRPEICFPPVVEQRSDYNESPGKERSLFEQLDFEVGLRNIVDSMLEQVITHNYNMFKEFREVDQHQKFISKYSMFLASLLEPRYQWFYKDQVESGQINALLVAEEDFETLIQYFNTACVKNDASKPAIINFLDFLSQNKETMTKNEKMLRQHDPLIESLEQKQKFEMFIERFFSAIANHPVLKQNADFVTAETRQDLTARITKILHSQNIQDLEIDKSVIDQVAANQNDPMILAAECFKETFMEVGVDEDSAETARQAFLNMKKGSVMEETQNRIIRITSKLSYKSSKRSSKQIDLLDVGEDNQVAADVSLNSQSAQAASGVQKVAGFDPEYDDSFKYDLQDMLPVSGDNSQSSDDFINTNKKSGVMAKGERSENAVILEGPINKYVTAQQSLIKRYIVLNQLALFVYKDEASYRNMTTKPAHVFPLSEIASIQPREFQAQQLVKNSTSFRNNEVVYVMEVGFKQGYRKMQQTIKNYQQNEQTKLPDGIEELGVIFADVYRKIIQKWVKKTQMAIKKAQSSNAAANGEVAQTIFDSGSNANSHKNGSNRFVTPAGIV